VTIRWRLAGVGREEVETDGEVKGGTGTHAARQSGAYIVGAGKQSAGEMGVAEVGGEASGGDEGGGGNGEAEPAVVVAVGRVVLPGGLIVVDMAECGGVELVEGIDEGGTDARPCSGRSMEVAGPGDVAGESRGQEQVVEIKEWQADPAGHSGGKGGEDRGQRRFCGGEREPLEVLHSAIERGAGIGGVYQCEARVHGMTRLTEGRWTGRMVRVREVRNGNGEVE
jgi:hypothetical protein